MVSILLQLIVNLYMYILHTFKLVLKLQFLNHQQRVTQLNEL